MEGTHHESAAAAAIEAEFEDRWGVWLSTTGTWWASRRDLITAADQSAGCVPYLRARSLGELSRSMREQEELHASALTLGTAVPGKCDERTSAPPYGQAGMTDDLATVPDEFPAFRIWKEVTGERTRYVARRVHGTHGLHTVVTADLAELRAVLAADSAAPRAGNA